MTVPTSVPLGRHVRGATSADTARIAPVLARAFFDDPVFTWWIPDAERRRRTLPPFFDLFVETFLAGGEVHVDGGDAGAALWGPPANPLGVEDEEEFTRRMEQIVAEVDLPRAFEIVTMQAEHHPAEPAHYYLQFVGVDPDCQGQGIGAALLAPVLDRCDRDHVGAYTEATSLRNRRLYERHGFTFLSEIAPASGPPMYRMWREPAR